jgi:hypothetical protein
VCAEDGEGCSRPTRWLPETSDRPTRPPPPRRRGRSGVGAERTEGTVRVARPGVQGTEIGGRRRGGRRGAKRTHFEGRRGAKRTQGRAGIEGRGRGRSRGVAPARNEPKARPPRRTNPNLGKLARVCRRPSRRETNPPRPAPGAKRTQTWEGGRDPATDDAPRETNRRRAGASSKMNPIPAPRRRQNEPNFGRAGVTVSPRRPSARNEPKNGGRLDVRRRSGDDAASRVPPGRAAWDGRTLGDRPGRGGGRSRRPMAGPGREAPPIIEGRRRGGSDRPREAAR